MPITLINHDNSPIWTDINKRLTQNSNGARIYSEAITKWYYPVFESIYKHSERNVALITVTAESRALRFKDYDRIFLFMHECNYLKQPTIARAKRFKEANPQAEVTFILWNEATVEQFRINHLDAIFVPMAIDLSEIRDAYDPRIKKVNKKIIWFGHLRRAKTPYYKYFVEEANKLGWHVDCISDNRFNGTGPKLTRNEILRVLQHYKYGVGVGQCAHEMAALGLKVILYAYNFRCNCPYTEQKAKYYMHRNLVSQEETNVLVKDAIKNIDQLVNFTPVGIEDQAQKLRQILLEHEIKQ